MNDVYHFFVIVPALEYQAKVKQELELFEKKIKTFVCPWYLHDRNTMKPLYQTRDEYEQAYAERKFGPLLSNAEIHLQQEETDANEKRDRQILRWNAEIDKEMYNLDMI
jgi:hypothetical protein